jgi:hypothetical protein
MGLLTDYFAATIDEDAKRVVDKGPRASGLPAVEAKGLDPVVTMATLEGILTGADPMAIIGQGAGAVIAQAGDEGPWVARLRGSVVEALGKPDAAALAQAAREWSKTEELAGSDPQQLYEFLWNLAHLSQWALANNQSVYCWMSL